MMADVYEQKLSWTTDNKDLNIYGYIRSPRGYGKECDILAIPLNYKPSIVYGLTFLNILASDDSSSWLSKDLLVLFYHETDYSISIKEFLQQYY